MSSANTVVVLDFETTGLSPQMGDRAIEIGAVKLSGGEEVDEFQALMNPGRPITPFIEDYTGITNEMLSTAEPCAKVMNDFADFIGDSDLIAHNASFDKKFLDNELTLIKRKYTGEFGCSLLVSRRIVTDSPNYKLGTLVNFLNIPSSGTYHRALYDAQMTAKVWIKMLKCIQEQYQIFDIPFSLIQKISKTPKKNVPKLLSSLN